MIAREQHVQGFLWRNRNNHGRAPKHWPQACGSINCLSPGLTWHHPAGPAQVFIDEAFWVASQHPCMHGKHAPCTHHLNIAFWPVLEDAEHAPPVFQGYEKCTGHALEHEPIPPGNAVQR
eukprot:1161105-Pelagomonas_calceolata.AAC.2